MLFPLLATRTRTAQLFSRWSVEINGEGPRRVPVSPRVVASWPIPYARVTSMVQRFLTSTFALAGSLALVTLLSGCASSSNGVSFGTAPVTSTSGSLVAGGAASVYALEDASSTTTATANDVLAFPAASSGTSTVPAVTVPLSTLVPTGAAFDGNGLLYVSGDDDTSGVPSVNVYAAGATAGSAPLRTFLPNAAFEPVGIAVSASGQAYVVEGEYDAYGNVLATQIEVFAPGATSGTAPAATITGSATQLIDPQDIAVDTAGNIYVANYQDDNVSQILVFAAGLNGNVAPSRSINFNGEITGVAVDSSSNMYAAEVSTAGAASIVEYAAGTTGAATAIKTISGTTSGLSAASTGAVRVDAAGNIWLIQQSPNTSATPATYFEAWPPSANGNVAPGVDFAPPSLLNPNGAFAVR